MVILEDLLGWAGDAVTVWEAPLEGGRSYFPVGLKTEPGPAAPLLFSFFSSPTFTFLGGLLGVIWGFDWIPTSRGLFCSSLQGPGPNPIIALCLSQTRLGPASNPRGTWCTFHKLRWLPYPVKLQQVSGSHLFKKRKEKIRYHLIFW